MALKGSTGASGVAGAEVLIPVPLPPGHGSTIARCFSTVNSRVLKLTFLSQARHISCNFIPLPSPGQKNPVQPTCADGRDRCARPDRRLSVEQAVMDGADGAVGLLAVDDAGDLDLAGGDHMDVDVAVGQRREH